MTPSETSPLKLIYLAKRNPALSRAAFTERWREHGALGMSLPRWRNIARYVHCDVLLPSLDTSALDTEYDGVGLIWYRSPQARAAHVADTSSQSVMEQDEQRTFSERISNCSLLASQFVAKAPGPPRAAATKLIAFLKDRTAGGGMDLPQRRTVGAERLEATLAEGGFTVRGHVINAPLPRENPNGWGLRQDCVEEWWFDDEYAALSAAGVLRADAGMETLIVLTNEVQLYAI